VLRHLQSKLLGTFTPFGTHIPNFPDECRKLVNSPTSGGTESERQIVPRALVFLYTMRNKRGIGHVGGDVDANSIDISAMTKVADWIVCELIRIYHGLSLEEAPASNHLGSCGKGASAKGWTSGKRSSIAALVFVR
jgi:hypothetical protein